MQNTKWVQVAKYYKKQYCVVGLMTNDTALRKLAGKKERYKSWNTN